MVTFITFIALSGVIIAISWRTLFNIRSHGFYRFLSWECIAFLIASNYIYWFVNPFGYQQIISWVLLFVSLYLVLAGVFQIKKAGRPSTKRADKQLYDFEKTSELIDTGIYKYIRHPLYGSLIFLSWGIFLKNASIWLLIVTAASTFFLYLTAVCDEKECIGFFGDKYVEYMKRSKRFIPFIF